MPGLTLPEQIANQLRRDILRGKLPPGATIKERDSAAELGVSRTPMREAIRILAKEGLVVLRPARSPIVAQPSFRDVADNIEVLSALELLSAELACARASEEQIAEIVAVQDRMAASYDTLDLIDVFELDMKFHRAIARASNNAVLAETHRAILSRLWRARYLSASRKKSRDRVLAQHSAIVEGLRARDAQAVRNHLHSHLEQLLVNVREFFETEDEDPSPAASRPPGRDMGKAAE
ncbi:GntR family transcriptional regulator [Pseudoponticoccus marisrubri]|uniref:GntR family transcriptional regulator n=1 Tax=Pseudoponticoccus marisrubri TaxID=1685382 RepID=A0A0W7WNC3_9RHOB|nr:GntR family transcriptional regulator [Pseudoponticoccus marisrubri]KUF12099.1 GntR family transcriptional regulator [Pseudoponticoccus marisrubri]